MTHQVTLNPINATFRADGHESVLEAALLLNEGAPAVLLVAWVVRLVRRWLDLRRLRPWFERYGDARPQLVDTFGVVEATGPVTPW